MPNYEVYITKYWNYIVNADSEDEAEDKVYELFRKNQLSPIADTSYDEIEVEELD